MDDTAPWCLLGVLLQLPQKRLSHHLEMKLLLCVDVHDVNSLYNGVGNVICYEYIKHISPVNRVEGFFEVYESDCTLTILVFDPLNSRAKI